MTNKESNILLIKKLQDKDVRFIVDKFRIFYCEGGYKFGPHKHEHIEINYVKRGSCRMRFADVEEIFNETDCMVLLPGVEHYFYIPENKNCILVQLEFQINEYNFLNQYSNLKDNFLFFHEILTHSNDYFKISGDTKISLVIERIIDELKNEQDGFEELTKLYFSELFILLSRNIKSKKNVSRIKHSNRFIHNAIEIINNRFADKITIEEIAKKCNVSSRYLRKVFHKEMGLNLSEYIKSLRLQKAKELMDNLNLNLTNISQQSGFSNQQYFCKVFKDSVGVSPKEYRLNLFRLSK